MNIRIVARDEDFTLSMNDRFAGLFEGSPWRLFWYNRGDECFETRAVPRDVKSVEDAEAWAQQYFTINGIN
ncbi:hypothetical protein [Streptomyces sp. 4N124]|uniref:hypothetical protein n=1 Tax=Streptomyces sp. 4N124 TaxID=3457420 RepID=UPI003FD22FF4